jgi:hypothetical protein
MAQTGELRIAAARRATGGASGNARLTALTAAALIVLLAVEGVTIPWIRPLLTVHVFVGMLLLVPVGLKLVSTGYRFASYYLGRRDYVASGPPPPLMRYVVAPVLVVSTITLFASGIAAAAMGHGGPVLGLHKASFVVWFGACSLHVLGYGLRALRYALADRRDRLAGAGLRITLVVGAVAAGVAIALATLPLAHDWQPWAG